MDKTLATAKLRNVLIIGAGIGGPVLAMWLRRLGLEVTVAEAREGATLADGAFLGVAPNGMNALIELGVAEAVAAQGFACSSFSFSNRKGARIGGIDRSRDAEQLGHALTMVRRSELHRALAHQAEQRGARLLYGKKLVELDRSRHDAVIARFEDRSELTADIVVGCDGIGSLTRRIILPDAPAPTPIGLLDCGGFARDVAVPVPPGCNEMVFGERAFFGAFQTSTGETWWFHNGPVTDRPLDPPALRERILELHRNDPAWIGRVIMATPEILGPWSVHELVEMPRWSDGRVCLMGDAAHAMSPSAGQGASMAIEDALVLARALRDRSTVHEAFAAFEAARRPRVDAITRFARRSGSGKALESRAAEWFRDLMMPFFLRLGAATQNKSYAYRLAWNG